MQIDPNVYVTVVLVFLVSGFTVGLTVAFLVMRRGGRHLDQVCRLMQASNEEYCKMVKLGNAESEMKSELARSQLRDSQDRMFSLMAMIAGRGLEGAERAIADAMVTTPLRPRRGRHRLPPTSQEMAEAVRRRGHERMVSEGLDTLGKDELGDDGSAEPEPERVAAE